MSFDDYATFPLRTFLGMDISSATAGTAEASLVVDDKHLNPNGVVHGAVLFALVDTAMGAAAMSVLAEGRYATSVDIQFRFVRPASTGRLSATVEVIKAGRNLIHLEGRITGEDDKLISTAAGTFTTFDL
ncbi:MAG: PaaI family thioesterase [Microthrixaceae bacterium]|nr:PaaI family thioesterase [Acidimicrobiales bacterium]MCB9404567.1 PaaI family thioesterase [Microthrixaceae bacterium]